MRWRSLENTRGLDVSHERIGKEAYNNRGGSISMFELYASGGWYFTLTAAKIVESDELLPGIVVDFDADGQMVGFESWSAGELVISDQAWLITVP